jgi:methionine synthase II (cobalamin-independent)
LFACLSGAYPRGSLPGQPERLEEGRAARVAGTVDGAIWTAIADTAVREVVEEQAISGLGILADGDLRPDHRLVSLFESWDGVIPGPLVEWPGSGEHVPQPVLVSLPRLRETATLEAWRFADGCTDFPVKQRLPGPYTLGWVCHPTADGREAATLAFADGLAQELAALARAGCPMVQIDEDLAGAVGDSATEGRLFLDAQRRLLSGTDDGMHRCLAVTAASAAAASRVLFEAPYQSYLVDLVRAPDNWRIVAGAPPDRGVICAVADASSPQLDSPETLIWAAALAAGRERSPDRVGIAPSGGMLGLRRERARRKIEVMGEAVRAARLGPLGEVARSLVPAPALSRIESLRDVWAAAAAAGLTGR